MCWRALLIVGVQYKKWDRWIVFSPIDFKFFGKQEVWEMDSPLNKVILIRVSRHQSWWFLSQIFMESQRLEVGKLKRIIQKVGSSTPMFEMYWGKEILGREDFSCPIFCIGSQWPNHIFHFHESLSNWCQGPNNCQGGKLLPS